MKMLLPFALCRLLTPCAVAQAATPAQPPTTLTLPNVPNDKAPLYGMQKTVGTTLKVTYTESVTVGASFIDPYGIPFTIQGPTTLKGTPVGTVLGLPPGVEAHWRTFNANNPIPSLELRFKNGAVLPLGEHALKIKITVGTLSVTVPFTLIRTKARILLVDDDFSENNQAGNTNKTLSPTDTAFRTALAKGITFSAWPVAHTFVYDTIVVDSQSPGPDAETLAPYDVVIWYCGTSFGGNPDGNATVGGGDEVSLRTYLDQGEERTLLLFSAGYINNIQGYVPSAGSNENKWNVTENTFLKRYVGAAGGQGLVKRFADADLTIEGKPGIMGKGPLEAQLSPINAKSAQVVATAVLNPDGTQERPVPVATLNRVGEANCAFVGFTWENLSTKDKLFRRLLATRVSLLRGRE